MAQERDGDASLVSRRFLCGKAQVSRSHFAQLPTPSQPRQGKRRVGPRRDDEVHLRWQVVQEKGQQRWPAN